MSRKKSNPQEKVKVVSDKSKDSLYRDQLQETVALPPPDGYPRPVILPPPADEDNPYLSDKPAGDDRPPATERAYLDHATPALPDGEADNEAYYVPVDKHRECD